jgi:rubrerythrin
MTKDALISAFGGESMAHMRYLVSADIAEKEGYQNVARLFKGIAYAEYVHARNHYNRLRDFDEDAKVSSGAPIGPGNTSKNLALAIRGEEYEVDEMYPAFMELAKFQDDNQSLRSFRYAWEAEKIHAELYKEAKDYVDKGKDWPLKTKVWICPVCGHTVVGEAPPDRCPICNTEGRFYKSF